MIPNEFEIRVHFDKKQGILVGKVHERLGAELFEVVGETTEEVECSAAHLLRKLNSSEWVKGNDKSKQNGVQL